MSRFRVVKILDCGEKGEEKMADFNRVEEVADVQQALEITALRNGNGRSTQPLFRVESDNTSLSWKLIKVVASKHGYTVDDLKGLQMPPYISREIVREALPNFGELFD